MILRTPPPKRPRPTPEITTPPSNNLVIYEDPTSPTNNNLHESSHSEQMLCTYQCRQLVKSDLLDNYGSMEKSISEYQSKLETLSDNLVKAETEAKNYRDQFHYSEQELAAARGREQALQEKALKEIRDTQEHLKKQIQQCSELEVKLQKELNTRASAESSAAAAEEKAKLLERSLKNLSESAEREKRNLQDELLHFKKDSKLSLDRQRIDLEKLEFRARNAENESVLLKEKLDEVNEQLAKCLRDKTELQKKLTSFTTPLEDASSSQNHVLVKHLQEELRNYELEVHEARKLKASHENVELLKEKLLEERGRRERSETELLKLQEIQLSMKVLEDELSSWKKLSVDIPGVSSSDDVCQKIVALQKEVIDGLAKMGDAKARVKQLEVALETAELNKRNAEAEAALAKEKEESLKLEVKQLESKLASVVQERELLSTAINELKQQSNAEHGLMDGTEIQDLKSSLAQKDGFIKELEDHLSEQKVANDRHRNEIRLLNEKLNSEERRIKCLDRETDNLRSEIALLESKLGHGDFSAANTKVLRMVNAIGVDNEARQTIEALQRELQMANEKLKVVEELKRQSADAGLLVDSYISGKILQLKEQIATLEKREERYKTVFADRISVFRRACCELFGYKIVMDDQQRPNGIPVTRFTLQSIYAQNDDEKLEFEYESGNTNILMNEYTKQRDVSQQVEIFIRKLNSIPAFTANLTVESFNRRTLS